MYKYMVIHWLGDHEVVVADDIAHAIEQSNYEGSDITAVVKLGR